MSKGHISRSVLWTLQFCPRFRASTIIIFLLLLLVVVVEVAVNVAESLAHRGAVQKQVRLYHGIHGSGIGGRCVCIHQMLALFCVKWRHSRHLKVWRQIDAHLLEKRSCHIASHDPDPIWKNGVFYAEKCCQARTQGGIWRGTKTPQYAKKVHIFCILYADIVDQ